MSDSVRFKHIFDGTFGCTLAFDPKSRRGALSLTGRGDPFSRPKGREVAQYRMGELTDDLTAWNEDAIALAIPGVHVTSDLFLDASYGVAVLKSWIVRCLRKTPIFVERRIPFVEVSK